MERALWPAIAALVLVGARGTTAAPAGVVLVSFDATVPRNLVVELAWETASEAGLLGFNVYRSTDPDTGFERITPQLVASRGGTAQGATYTLEDLPGEGVFHYRLEVVDTAGRAELAAQSRIDVKDTRAFIYLPYADRR